MKKKIHKITKEYVDKYCLDDSFIGKSIVLYEDRINHIEKHKHDFLNDSLNDILDNLSSIVGNPDYINVDTTKFGIQIVKKIKDNILEAVRLSTSSELKIKSIYPINNTKYNKLKK